MLDRIFGQVMFALFVLPINYGMRKAYRGMKDLGELFTELSEKLTEQHQLLDFLVSSGRLQNALLRDGYFGLCHRNVKELMTGKMSAETMDIVREYMVYRGSGQKKNLSLVNEVW